MHTPNGAITVSEPAPLTLHFDEWMAWLAGADLNIFIGSAASSQHAHGLRLLQKSLGDSPLYLCDEPARRGYEIVYLKLSVFLRLLTVMRESHKQLRLPLGMASIIITATVSRSPGVAPAFWNYRLMTTPHPPGEGFSFADDARHFALLMAQSLLSNPRNSAAHVKQGVLEISAALNRIHDDAPDKQTRDGPLGNTNALLEHYLLQEMFHFQQVFYQPNHECQSRQVYAWKKLVKFLFKLTTHSPGFSYYHAHSVNPAQIVNDIVRDLKMLQNEFKAKLFEPLHTDKTVATLLNELFA